MSSIDIHAWRLEERGTKYTIQFSKIKTLKDMEKIEKAMEKAGWNGAGDSYFFNKKEYSIMFTRSFPTKQKWIRWAEKFPMTIKQVGSRTGKITIIKQKGPS